MATPPNEAMRPMTAAERAVRARWPSASSARVDQVRRAVALVAVAEGWPCAQAARRPGFRRGTTGADLVARRRRRGVAAVTIPPGRGRNPTAGTTARRQIIATAQRPPDRKAAGPAPW